MFRIMWKNWNPMHCYWECKMLQLLWKTIWPFLIKLNIASLYHPANPVLGLFLKELKAGTQTDPCSPMLIAALFPRAERWK